jgi:hypothetical protein
MMHPVICGPRTHSMGIDPAGSSAGAARRAAA